MPESAGRTTADEPPDATTAVSLPEQKGFFKIPARFGHVPVAEEPLGYDPERRFEHHYPRIELPFQVVDVVKTAAERLGKVTEIFPQGRNRLFFGDCLHVMRMLPSESIDLIYIDPPFFSGRNYNIIFGDKNEVRSFSDIWEGGMPGYLIWLNSRLYEMKRLLKSTGSIMVHVDWHAAHYVKCELDKIFGYENFVNEIIWYYRRWTGSARAFLKMHDNILFYAKGKDYKFNPQWTDYTEESKFRKKNYHTRILGDDVYVTSVNPKGVKENDVWGIPVINSQASERIGYPTQKPMELLQKIIECASDRGDVVADFFCGGGTTLSVAQQLDRRWIGCDVSRVAVALTADRIAQILAPNVLEKKRSKPAKSGAGLFDGIVDNNTLTSVNEAKKKAVEESWTRATGYSVEHWGIYEINRLTKLSPDDFRTFVLACYGARKWTSADPNVHGVKTNELLWVAGPKETDAVTPADVKLFAEAVMRARKPEERQATMIGWAIDPKARGYAEQIMHLGETKPIQFIKLRLWPLAGEELKTHVTKKHTKYKDFFAFILPPEIPRIAATRVSALKYRFDVSESRSMNSGGKIVNVQWDFDFREGVFSATQGYQLCRKEKKGRGESGFEGDTTVEYTFEGVSVGSEASIACRVQDDLGGEGMKAMKLRIE